MIKLVDLYLGVYSLIIGTPFLSEDLICYAIFCFTILLKYVTFNLPETAAL